MSQYDDLDSDAIDLVEEVLCKTKYPSGSGTGRYLVALRFRHRKYLARQIVRALHAEGFIDPPVAGP